MENFCKRFPHLANSVFDQVDEQSLNICKEISGDVLEYLDKERFFWIRIIKKYQRRLKDFPKLWKLVIDKTPVEKIKEIAIAVSRFFNCNHLYHKELKNQLEKKNTQWKILLMVNIQKLDNTNVKDCAQSSRSKTYWSHSDNFAAGNQMKI